MNESHCSQNRPEMPALPPEFGGDLGSFNTNDFLRIRGIAAEVFGIPEEEIEVCADFQKALKATAEARRAFSQAVLREFYNGADEDEDMVDAFAETIDNTLEAYSTLVLWGKIDDPDTRRAFDEALAEAGE